MEEVAWVVVKVGAVVVGEGGGHLLYSVFTRKERIKIYKETPLTFPKTLESNSSASSTGL